MQSFQDLNLSEPILRAVTELGYETMTPIQAQALPLLLADESTDFLGLAATGTGKTAAFTIPLLERLDPSKRGVQALILCPTRELAVQVAGQIDLMGKFVGPRGVRALPIFGGAGYGDQIGGLKRGAQVVVGTPGRVVDHLNKGTLDLSGLQTLILDEADEMISMGFKEDLEAVLSSIPEGQANTWLFSATMSPEVRRIADAYLHEPRQVQVNRTEMIPDTVEQIYYRAHEGDKPEILCKIIEFADDFYGIIFCQTKSLVVDLTQYLKGRGYRVDCLHGDMEQNARTRTMNAFRERNVTVLVATDVACRGLDVKDISHVINYSLPRELDSYVHRIGRTGRSGKSGVAISLVTPSHRGLIPRIERMTKSRMNEGRLPTRKEVGAKKISQALARFEAETSHARAVELLGDKWKASLDAMSKEEIAGRFIAMVYPEIFSEQSDVAERAEATRTAPRVASNGVVINVGAGRSRPAARSSGYVPRESSGYVPREKSGYVPREGAKSAPRVATHPKARPAAERDREDEITEIPLTGVVTASMPALTLESLEQRAAAEPVATRVYDRVPAEKKRKTPWEGKKSYAGEKPPYEKKAYSGEKPAYGEKKPYSGEKKPYDKKPWGKSADTRSWGEKKKSPAPWGAKKPKKKGGGWVDKPLSRTSR